MKHIALSKETVRKLSDHQLQAVNGGKRIKCDTYLTVCYPPVTCFVPTVITCKPGVCLSAPC